MDSAPFRDVGRWVPVEAIPTSCIRYAFSNTISYPRNIIASQEGALNVNISVSTAGDLNLQATLQQHGNERPKYKKTQFTVCQRRELEKAFSQAQYITPVRRQLLSQQLGISGEVIQTWFKNRRVKWRKEKRKIQTQPSTAAARSVSTGLHFRYFGHVPYPSNKLMMKDAQMLFGTSTACASNDA